MKRTQRLEVLADEEAVASRAADLTCDLAKQIIEAHGRFTIALSGGSTPKLFHRALVARKDDLDWTRIHVFYSDERAVPPEHEHSNHRMAKETLLDLVPIPPANVHRIQADDGETERAATAYEGELIATAFHASIDLVLLGMGGDGHTASLFPGSAPRNDRLVLATVAPPESPVEQRVTFSYRALERARVVIVLITGAGKAARLAEVMGTEKVDLPLRKVLDSRVENTVLLVDEAAASQLPEERDG